MPNPAPLANLTGSLAAFLSRSGAELAMILGTIVAIAAVWVALYYWGDIRTRFRSGARNPRSLFDELCAAHGLSRPERDTLLQVAAGRELPQPAAIFVDPRHLQASAAAPSLLPRLFGDLTQ